MSLFSVFISSSHSPSLLYSICLYISLALSLLCLMSHISVSVCVFVHLVYGAKSNTSSLCMESFSVFFCTFYCCPSATFSCHSSPPLPLFSYGSNNAIQEVLMQHHANCQGAPTGGLSPALGYGTESNLTGVTEVRLECSHFSTSANFVHINGLRVTPSKIRAGWRLTGATVFHTVCFLFFFLKFRLHF